MARQAHRKISGLHGVQRIQQFRLIELGRDGMAVDSGIARASLAGAASSFRRCIARLGGGIPSPAGVA
jgi:hypothetical protein